MGLHLDRRADNLAVLAIDASADTLLTTDELAAWLGVHPFSVKRWRRMGVGPRGIRTGLRALRFRKSDVLDWLRQRAEG
jgi:excisionase family DNA binding protein